MKVSSIATAFALYASTSSLVSATPIEERSLSCSAQSDTINTIRDRENKPVDFCYLYLNGATKNPFSKLKASAVSSACSCVTKSAATATRTRTVTDKVTEIITRSRTKTNTVYRTKTTTTTVKSPQTVVKSTTVRVPQTVVKTTTVTAPGKNSVSTVTKQVASVSTVTKQVAPVSTVTKQVASVSTVTKQVPSGYTTTVTQQIPSGYTTTIKSSVSQLITVTTSALEQITSTVTANVTAEPSTVTISADSTAQPQNQTVTTTVTILPSCSAALPALNATASSNSTMSATTSFTSSTSTASPTVVPSNSTLPSDSTASTGATNSSCTSTNLPIVDPTFSNGLAAWGTHVGQGQVFASSQYGGKTAAELTCDASQDGPYDRSFVYQIFPTCPGTKYSVSWAYYLATAGDQYNSYLYLYDGAYSGDPTAGSPISGVSTGSATQGRWVDIDATFTAEGNSTILGVTLICAGYDSGTAMLVSDIVATIVD